MPIQISLSAFAGRGKQRSPVGVNSAALGKITGIYLWLLALVPLLVETQDREVQWHARHGIVLMVAEIFLGIALMVLTSAAAFAFFGLGCFVSLLTLSLWIAILIVHVVAIAKGLYGERLIIPCSHYAEVEIARYGLVVGGWRSVRRIARCGPWTPMGTVDEP